MSDDAIYQWKISRKDSVLGEIAAKVLSDPFAAVSRANLGEFCKSLLALMSAILIAAVVGWLGAIVIPQLLFFGLGSIVGHQIVFGIALVILLILFGILLVLLAVLLYLRCMLGMMERELSQIELAAGTIDLAQLAPKEREDFLATRDKCRRQLGKVKKQFRTYSWIWDTRLILVYFLWLMSYVLSSPASPFLSGFSGDTDSLMQWHRWFADMFLNCLLFDLPGVLFGSFSTIEASAWYARVAVFSYKILLVSSMVFFLLGALRQYWRKTEIFVGTEDELSDYLKHSGLFLDRGNFSAEREWKLVPVPRTGSAEDGEKMGTS